MTARAPVLLVVVLAGACAARDAGTEPRGAEAAIQAAPPSPTAVPLAPEAPRQPAPAPPAVVPPTPDDGCVGDPWTHGTRYLIEHHGDRLEHESGKRPTLADFDRPGAWCTSVGSLDDLDADGVDELEVSQCFGSYAAVRLIYLSNHGCLRFGGELVSGELAPMDTRTNGLRDLESTWSNGCAGLDFEWTRHAWSGTAYEVADTATCEFCEDDGPPDPGANRHPHCRAYARELAGPKRNGD